MLSDQTILGLVAFCLLFISAVTFRSARRCTTRLRIGARPTSNGISGDRHYKDEDGSSTASSTLELAFGISSLPANSAGAIAFLCSASNVLWAHVGPEQSKWLAGWIFLVAWGMICLQILYTFSEDSFVQRYNMGIWVGLSSLALVLTTTVDAYHRVALRDGAQIYAVFLGFTFTQIILGLVIFISAISIQRRPEVFKNGQPVDSQYTGSAFSRYTFGWVRPLLDHSRKQQRLEYSDLPALDHLTSSKDTLARFSSISSSTNGSLWYLVYKDHKATFLSQLILTVIESIAYHGPPYFLFQIVQSLENSASSMTNSDTWLLVGGLGFSLLFHLLIDTWIDWISFAHLAIPIRGQLSALIFEKSLHLKNLKTVSKTDDTTKEATEKELRANGTVSDQEDDAFEMIALLPEGGESLQNTKTKFETSLPAKEEKSNASQEILNLLGVDAQRVADFTGYNNLIPGAFIKVLLAIAFLIRLTGWRSVLAGLAVPILFVPFNSISTRNYAYYQGTVMKARDAKAKIATEALQGIRQIKFSATEFQWQELIQKARDAELKELWSSFVWACVMLFCWFSMPIILGGVVLGLHAWLNGGMQPSVAFTALAIFGKLEWCLSVVPLTITDFYDAKVSIGRIEDHLDRAESGNTTQDGESICFKDAHVRWPSEDDDESLFTLNNLNMEFPSGELSIICGKTGSGKGLLLAAILGEADIISGAIFVPRARRTPSRQPNGSGWVIPSTMAYVAQIPWIENATIKENILFGATLDADRFQKVIRACALLPDLLMLPDGEETEIGDKGINLSGGQRWRVTLARALYSRAEILIMDDIFSAVDAHVGRHILEHALLGDLARGRTRILATHHIGLVLPFASYGVFLGNGGSVLRAGPVPNEDKVRARGSQRNTMAREESADKDAGSKTLEKNPQNTFATKKFVEDEKRERGRISWNTYKAYVYSSGGFLPWFWTLSFFVLLPASIFGRSWLVKMWTESSSVSHEPNSTLLFYLTVYLSISVFSAMAVAIKVLLVCIVAIRASRKLFEKFTYAVLRAPLRWLDTVPFGRILNRMVGDFAMMDAKFPSDFIYSATSFLSLLAVIVAAIVVSPLTLIPFAILGFVCLYNASLFLHGAREMKRLESSSKSPIFDLYGSVLAGLDTIRSFDKTNDYSQRMLARIDRYSQSSWYLWLATRWLSFRMGVIGTIFALTVAALVLGSRTIDASLAGFALSYALEYSATIVQSIRRYAGVELDMNCTERIVEYATMPIESQSGVKVHSSWPYEGRISIQNLEVRYASDLPSVLKGLNFSVEPGKRIGIVGRTGSGKSSLALSIFRFLEASHGVIIIDGQDISKMRLHDLRSRICIIPQDPVLFSGTVRSNLDIFGTFNDAVLRNALKRVHLEERDPKPSKVEAVSSQIQHSKFSLGLDSIISDGGLNLSQGQRQLLCLARAIVAQPKIIILDEATSAVDMDTDGLIQKSIRESFSNCTMLVIAHRLSTVADFDRVLVMDNGQALEYDTPKKLFESRGAFYSMLQESGELETLRGLADYEG